MEKLIVRCKDVSICKEYENLLFSFGDDYSVIDDNTIEIYGNEDVLDSWCEEFKMDDRVEYEVEE